MFVVLIRTNGHIHGHTEYYNINYYCNIYVFYVGNPLSEKVHPPTSFLLLVNLFCDLHLENHQRYFKGSPAFLLLIVVERLSKRTPNKE